MARETSMPIFPVPITPTVRPCRVESEQAVEREVALADARVGVADLAIEREDEGHGALGHRVR